MTADILHIAIPSPLYRCFDYLAPAGVDITTLQPGMRVRVPFGQHRKIGVLLALHETSPLPRSDLREVLEVLDSEPLLSRDILALLHWAQQYYHHPPGDVLATALPILLRQGKPAQRATQPLWCITPAGLQALQADQVAKAPQQQALLQHLAQAPQGLSSERLREALKTWSSVIKALRKKGWVQHFQATPAQVEAVTAPQLTSAQTQAVDAVCAALGQFQSFLLEGITGSGKTEVYLRIIEQVLERQQQALILVPEIGLTPQLLARFQARLPVPLATLHSGLSDRERLDAWLDARSGHARVVIGTRSATFAPLPQLGVIIIDEEHDSSFKQQDGFRYHGRDLAIVRAQQCQIPIVLGSATPALESLHNVTRKRHQILRLPQRVGGAVEPDIELLDVRSQPMTAGLSRHLLERMTQHLQRGEQVLLFLNRRGFAPTLICHECGWLCQCQSCDAHMTLHLRRQRLICHHCGSQQQLKPACPVCGSVDLRALGQGTERIEQALRKHFPHTGIARIDRDSTRRKGSLQQILDAIYSGHSQLLIGTQMLAKGHHFPNVTLVSIVNADQGLFSSDYRAGERMAQQILQVAGRAGRADKPGHVLIQTHHPEHVLLQTLVHQGYAAFAHAALAERQATMLPPFSYQALLRADATAAEPPHTFLREALTLVTTTQPLAVELLGPIPAPMERRAGRFRAQLLIQAQQRQQLHRFLGPWIEQLGALKSARKVRWSVDVDPIDLL